MTQRASTYVLAGGLDEISPALTVPRGRAIAVRNYESASSGYARTDGFDRYDGRQSPTDAYTLAPSSSAIAAREAARAIIQRVPGSGPIRGVASFLGLRYAWRDNIAGTAGTMYRAGPIGWVLISSAFPPGGRYLTINTNFYGASNRRAMYGVNGVGKAFTFDGATVTFITTGMDVDKPNRIAEFKKFLFLSFPGGSVQYSEVGEPTHWNPVLGAGEIAVGSDVTDFIANVDALHILTIDQISTLVGTGAADWQLQPLSNEEGQGGIPFTAQKVGSPLYLDVGGLRSIGTTTAYGNFKLGSLTPQIQPTLTAKRAGGVHPVASIVVKGKDQYRLFFGDGTGVTVYFGRKAAEPMLFEYGVVVTCLCSEFEAATGERIFAGDNSGMVYELDVGTSFDGAAIVSYLQLGWDNEGGPDILKRYHKAVLELDATPDTLLAVTAEFDYANGQQSALPRQTFTVSGGGGLWDAISWDNFYWSAPAEGQAEAWLDGEGENISLVILSSGTEQQGHTLSSIKMRFSVRGAKR